MQSCFVANITRLIWKNICMHSHKFHIVITHVLSCSYQLISLSLVTVVLHKNLVCFKFCRYWFMLPVCVLLHQPVCNFYIKSFIYFLNNSLLQNFNTFTKPWIWHCIILWQQLTYSPAGPFNKCSLPRYSGAAEWIAPATCLCTGETVEFQHSCWRTADIFQQGGGAS